MIQSLLDSTPISLLEQVARFTEHRHRALAGNLANIDTPNYRPRDLPVEEFRRALSDFVESRKAGGESVAAGRGHDSVQQHFSDELFQPAYAPAENITFLDGANRSVEAAVMQMVKNASQQRFAIEVLTAQFNLLQAVISERA